MAVPSGPKPSFFGIPAEVRSIIYGFLLAWTRPLKLCPTGTLATATSQGLETAILFVCKQTCIEALPLLYHRNSFVIRQGTALRLYLAVTPNKAMKLNNTRHIILSQSYLVNKTRIAEMKRLKKLGKLTIVSQWFGLDAVPANYRPYPPYFDLTRVCLDYGAEHRRLFEVDSMMDEAGFGNTTSADHHFETKAGTLSWVRRWIYESAGFIEIMDMIIARPRIDYEVVVHGLHESFTSEQTDGSSSRIVVSVRFDLSWSAEEKRYKYRYKAHENTPEPQLPRTGSQ